MKTRLIIAFLGNLIDAAATLHLTSLGYTEANPVMARLLHYPVLFATIKMALMTTVLLWIWKRRGDRNASVASWIAAITYAAISIYYVIFFAVLY